MLVELVTICVTVIILTVVITRVFVARARASEALNKRMALMRKAKSKKASSDEEEEGSLVDALLEELGVPPTMAMPIIQGMIQQWMNKGKPPGSEPAPSYT